ncbi:hypothetical protein BGP_3392 [Beggiatoa sp. PS]|nr:hypothetical protein BGP_3392 [Beggiatoa sp. PS]
MTIIVQSSNEGIISLPASLMRRERRNNSNRYRRKVLRLTSLEPFIALRGTLSENTEFEATIQ